MSVSIDFGVTISRLASQGEAVIVYEAILELLREENLTHDMSEFSMWEEHDQWTMSARTDDSIAVMYAYTWSQGFEADFSKCVADVAPHARVEFWWEYPDEEDWVVDGELV